MLFRSMILYINGERRGSVEKEWEGALNNSDKKFFINFRLGKGQLGGNPTIDEYKIFNKVLSEDEIKGIFMGAGSLIEQGEYKEPKQEIEPVFLAQFEDNTKAGFMNKELYGNVGVRVNYDKGVSGKGVIIKRYMKVLGRNLLGLQINPRFTQK